MSKVVLTCGKICCGKSYYAKQLKDKEKAILLGIDEITYDLFDNNLGNNHDEMVFKIQNYFMKKTVEIVRAGSTVILDWGFWSKYSRRETTNYFQAHDIPYEWHYIDINEDDWYKNIDERNEKVATNNKQADFYVEEGLIKKLLSLFEEPTKGEIDVWYSFKRY